MVSVAKQVAGLTLGAPPGPLPEWVILKVPPGSWTVSLELPEMSTPAPVNTPAAIRLRRFDVVDALIR
jgi:hypothetical protein